MDLVVALIAFAGGLSGAVLAFVAARRATAADTTARRQEEWGRRFTTALEAFTGADPGTRAVGRTLLVELSESDLASPEDRRTALSVLEAGATAGVVDGGDDVPGQLRRSPPSLVAESTMTPEEDRP